jgi:hypothetical protein
MDQPRLLDTKNAARFLGLSAKTLESWRYADRDGLPYIKNGPRLIFYDVSDLLRFLESRKVHGKSAVVAR